MSDSPRTRLEALEQTLSVRHIAREDGLSLEEAGRLAREGSRVLGLLGLTGYDAGPDDIRTDEDGLYVQRVIPGETIPLTGFEATSYDYTGKVAPYDRE